jgi:hypothetical protein
VGLNGLGTLATFDHTLASTRGRASFSLDTTLVWWQTVHVTLELRIETTRGPVMPVLARAAGLYPAHAGSIPVTGSKKSTRQQTTSASPVARIQADRNGRVIFEGTRPDQPSL